MLIAGFCQTGTILENRALAQSIRAGSVNAGSGRSLILPTASAEASSAFSERAFSEKTAAKTSAGGLTIIPTFDSSITTNPNAAAMENSINAAIGVLEVLLSDPITVSIYFRYSSTQPGGQPTDLSNSYYGYYSVPYGTYIAALKADAKTANDTTAVNNLPANALATSMDVTTALGRALGMNTAGVVDASGGVNKGGTFDGIVTISSTQPVQFSRAGGIAAGNFDAQRLIEHEMDEVMGFGSILPSTGSSAVKPEDLFRYSAAGSTSLTLSASTTSYFSIDGGASRIAGFNQQSGGLDYGDWLSPACAAEAITPLVQYAITCPGTAADVSAISPEGIALDVIGYDLRTSVASQTISFTALPNVIFGAAPFIIRATASSGLPVTFTSTTPGVCTVSGASLSSAAVTIVQAGACSITASQAGNANFAAASPVIQSFTVTYATGMAQSISFGPLSSVPVGTAPFVIVATATSNLAVSFASTTAGVCTISGNLVTLVAAGLCSITASQSGNSTYAAAIPVIQTFTVFGPRTALQLMTVTPCRIMDTRNPNGPLGGPYVSGGTTRAIPIPSSPCNVPANAAAYSLNFTVVPRAGALSYLSVWPAGQTQPLVSTLNSLDGSTIANAAIVPAGIAGAIEAYATNDTDLIVDINGYFVPPASNSLQFYPLTPCRVLDTRTLGQPIVGGTSSSFAISSRSCGTITDAAAYALNVTVVPRSALGYLTVWPAGQAQPLVSTLNSFDGTVLANAAIVPAGANGAVSFYASNTTDLVVDINGYFASPKSNGLNFYTLTPCRLVDTRNPKGTFGGPTMGPGTTRAFPLSQGSCGLPAVPGAQAYSLNMTVVPQGVLSYLSTWPAGATQPVVSTLNAFKGQIAANAAIVPAGGAGSVDVYVTNTTDVVIDTNGYFGP